MTGSLAATGILDGSDVRWAGAAVLGAAALLPVLPGHPHLLCPLLNALLDLPYDSRLTELTIQPSQMAGPLHDDKEVVLDIRARTATGCTLAK